MSDANTWAFGMCCGMSPPPPPVNDPPTISFAADPITGQTGVWTLNRPIDSENQLYGVWQDVDNVDGVSFRFILRSDVPGKEDRDITNLLDDIQPGDIYATTQQSWAISWSDFSYPDDYDYLIAEITDDAGNVATAEVQLDIPIDDIVRYLGSTIYQIPNGGHPKPRTGAWRYQGVNQNLVFDEDPPSWVVNPQPFVGGISVGSLDLTANGQGFGIEFENTTADRILLPVPGFRVLIPDGSKLRVVSYWVDENGSPKNNPQGIGDIIEYEGPQLRDFNFLAGVEDKNVFPLGTNNIDYFYDMSPGDKVQIEFYGLAPGDTPSTDKELVPWLEFSDMEVLDDGEEVVVVAPIGDTYETTFSWAATSYPTYPIVWNAYRGSLPVGIYGRPEPSKSGTGANFAGGPSFAQAWATGGGYEVPTLDSSGFRCERHDPAQDLHNQILPVSTHDMWTNGFYIKPYQRFRIDFSMFLTGANVWNSGNWFLLLDLHPGTFPGNSWADSYSPPVGVYVETPQGGSTRFVIRAKGSNQTQPVNYTRESLLSHPFAGPGFYFFVLEGRIDPFGAGYLEAYINGTYIGRIEHEIGINAGGSSIAGALNPKVGLYASSNPSTAGAVSVLGSFDVLRVT